MILYYIILYMNYDILQTVTDWKSKTKAKAGAITAHTSQTGGGESIAVTLSDNEKRLLNIMGKSSYQGNPENVERGFRKRKLFVSVKQYTYI